MSVLLVHAPVGGIVDSRFEISFFQWVLLTKIDLRGRVINMQANVKREDSRVAKTGESIAVNNQLWRWERAMGEGRKLYWCTYKVETCSNYYREKGNRANIFEYPKRNKQTQVNGWKLTQKLCTELMKTKDLVEKRVSVEHRYGPTNHLLSLVHVSSLANRLRAVNPLDSLVMLAEDKCRVGERQSRNSSNNESNNFVLL